MNPLSKQIGKEIAQHRKRKRMSVHDVAKQCTFPLWRYMQIEEGFNTTDAELKEISVALNENIDLEGFDPTMKKMFGMK